MEVNALAPVSSYIPSPKQKSLLSIEVIREELQNALKSNFDFTGNFYFHESQTTAPNPCLNLEGSRPIELPLNERDATAIINHASQAPFGRRDQTVVDTHVRDTWEIDPVKLKFDNPKWQNYVEEVVVKKVWSGLGVPTPSTPPRCELYKLLLYEQGSHFLPHQDTEKAKGMFATVIIVLPSAYTGGEVHLQHNGKTEIIDTASQSNISTSILAWYTDVMHEVKPITSGYRLALSYNLIHTSSTPIPQIPGSSAASSQLRAVLMKWSDSAPERGESNLLASLLKHEYTKSNLKNGLNTLKGEDAHLMAHLKPILDDLGFSAFLAQITYYIAGPGDSWDDEEGEDEDEDEDGDNESHRPPLKSVDGFFRFVEIHERRLSIEHLVDLEGNEIDFCGDPIEIENVNLVPEDPFDEVEPDEVEDEGYMGNEAGPREHWYHRTVLLLIPECSADEIMFSSAGLTYALSRLDRSSPNFPTSREKKTLDSIIAHLIGCDREAAMMMADYAVEWKDLDRWKKVVKEAFDSFGALGVEKLVQAWKAFGFENVQTSFESVIILSSKSLKNRMDLLHNLLLHASPDEQEVLQTWSSAQEERILASISEPSIEDIPYILEAGKKRGATFMEQVIQPQLAGLQLEEPTSPFEFLLNLAQATHASIDSIASGGQRKGLDSTQTQLDAFIGRCLDLAWDQWDKAIAPSDNSRYRARKTASMSPATISLQIDRLIAVLDAYLTTDLFTHCHKINTLLANVEQDKQTQYRVMFIPLCEKLQPLLHKHDLKIFSPPFDDFFRSLTEKYLQVLLPLPHVSKEVKIRQFRCSCKDCKNINAFLADRTSSERVWRLGPTRRTHLEKSLADINDLVTFVTIQTGDPHGVQVSKVPDLVATQKREVHVVDATTFLKSLGSKEDVLELMGDRIPDLRMVLQGKEPEGIGREGGQASGSRKGSQSQLAKPTVPVAGQKRKTTNPSAAKPPLKKPRNLGAIDLTMDSN